MIVEWRKASRSTSEGGACVEVARLSPRSVGIRDSKDAAGPRLALSPSAARRLADVIRAREGDAL
ncbi:DUF397 domain-containing protein [Actinomadura harenae]|uniref:DUF397 domain-containing protein n=1 Tax=Actinomadura harenae TaxID=2483351 RepID=A0A3M2M852_9ACTN|nr:DUF397 domain-containing protein [Actinomadura harenae]RMI44745.1 DUF397 domain-containing protein [Actinomadura harenae]